MEGQTIWLQEWHMVIWMCTVRDGLSKTTIQGQRHEYIVCEGDFSLVPSYTCPIFDWIPGDNQHDAVTKPRPQALSWPTFAPNIYVEPYTVAKSFRSQHRGLLLQYHQCIEWSSWLDSILFELTNNAEFVVTAIFECPVRSATSSRRLTQYNQVT